MKPQDALARVIEHREIFHDEMVSLMRQIMSGEVTPVMIAAIITGSARQEGNDRRNLRCGAGHARAVDQGASQ
jgi:anthranilate phosphoribosyltransferase